MHNGVMTRTMNKPEWTACVCLDDYTVYVQVKVGGRVFRRWTPKNSVCRVVHDMTKDVSKAAAELADLDALLRGQEAGPVSG